MAHDGSTRLDTGDLFPELRLQLLGGEELTLPRDAAGRWAVFLGYRGHG